MNLYTDGWTPHGNHDTRTFRQKVVRNRVEGTQPAQSHFSNGLAAQSVRGGDLGEAAGVESGEGKGKLDITAA